MNNNNYQDINLVAPAKTPEEKVAEQAKTEKAATLAAARTKVEEARAKAQATSNTADQVRYINLKNELTELENN
jgi:hypothetical protein